MTEPDVVPEKMKNPIDYRVLALIVGVGIAIMISFNFMSEEDVGNIVFPGAVASAWAASITSFIVAKRYIGTHVFGKAYFALGLAFLSYGIGEVIFYTLDIFGMEVYPSIADIFFFALYPLLMTHLIINIRFFNVKLSTAQKIWLPLIPIIFVLAYGFISFEELTSENIDDFDFLYGIIFLAGAAVVFSLSLLGATIFRQGLLGVAWLLLVIGLLINALGDLWYYVEELIGYYHDAHPVTVIWWIANAIVVYALYKHQKVM